MVIKAAVERITPTAVAPVADVVNVRRAGNQLQHESRQFEQLLENKARELKQPKEELGKSKPEPDSFLQYVTYDMRAYASWEVKNRMDIKG